jgi:hypothetical protein
MRISAENVAYSEGRLFAFTQFRICAAVLLTLVFFGFLPRPRRAEALLIGAAAGLATSVLDRFSWDWFNGHGGFFVALFGIPALSGSVVVLLFLRIQRQWLRDVESST